MSKHYSPTPAGLRKARESKFPSQDALAEALGWAREEVNAVECSRKAIGLKRLHKWAAACGCEVRLVPIDRMTGG
jgi:transcriptional regulator with XRE-family HTH domain